MFETVNRPFNSVVKYTNVFLFSIISYDNYKSILDDFAVIVVLF